MPHRKTIYSFEAYLVYGVDMRWSIEEIERLKENPHAPTSELQKLLPNRTKKAIDLKLINLGIHRPYMMESEVKINLNLTQYDMGVIVGLIEGEGSIGLGMHKLWKNKNGRVYLRPYVSISNSDFEIHSFLREKLIHGNLSKSKLPLYDRKIMGQYQIFGHIPISKLLELIIPRMLTSRKRNLAILVKEFCDRRLSIRSEGKWARYEKRDWEIYLTASKLNYRGLKGKYLEHVAFAQEMLKSFS